jgi:hypothetical protein
LREAAGGLEMLPDENEKPENTITAKGHGTLIRQSLSPQKKTKIEITKNKV